MKVATVKNLIGGSLWARPRLFSRSNRVKLRDTIGKFFPNKVSEPVDVDGDSGFMTREGKTLNVFVESSHPGLVKPINEISKWGHILRYTKSRCSHLPAFVWNPEDMERFICSLLTASMSWVALMPLRLRLNIAALRALTSRSEVRGVTRAVFPERLVVFINALLSATRWMMSSGAITCPIRRHIRPHCPEIRRGRKART